MSKYDCLAKIPPDYKELSLLGIRSNSISCYGQSENWRRSKKTSRPSDKSTTCRLVPVSQSTSVDVRFEMLYMKNSRDIVFEMEYISLSKSQLELHRGLQKSHQQPKTAFPHDSLTALRHPVRTGPIISMKAEAHDCRIVWIVVSQDVACEMHKFSHIDCAQLPPDSPVIKNFPSLISQWWVRD